jgi:hypothetical protein
VRGGIPTQPGVRGAYRREAGEGRSRESKGKRSERECERSTPGLKRAFEVQLYIEY